MAVICNKNVRMKEKESLHGWVNGKGYYLAHSTNPVIANPNLDI